MHIAALLSWLVSAHLANRARPGRTPSTRELLSLALSSAALLMVCNHRRQKTTLKYRISSGAPLKKIHAGDKVRAQLRVDKSNNGRFYDGIVIAVNPHDANSVPTFHIKYADGYTWRKVPRYKILGPDEHFEEVQEALKNLELASKDIESIDEVCLRHTIAREVIDKDRLNALLPKIKEIFQPQVVRYANTNPLAKDETKTTVGEDSDGKGHGKNVQWKVSTYMEVDRRMGGAMQRDIRPCVKMRNLMEPILEECNEAFQKWYESLHGKGSIQHLVRLQSFITRYRPLKNQNALLRHIDGAQVDGSVVLALPTDVPFTGGGLTVWEGPPNDEKAYNYKMAPGDIVFLDNFVFHQGNPITSGERWALVIFYSVKEIVGNRLIQIIQKCAKREKMAAAKAQAKEAMSGQAH